jgi:hypothetical protein
VQDDALVALNGSTATLSAQVDGLGVTAALLKNDVQNINVCGECGPNIMEWDCVQHEHIHTFRHSHTHTPHTHTHTHTDKHTRAHTHKTEFPQAGLGTINNNVIALNSSIQTLNVCGQTLFLHLTPQSLFDAEYVALTSIGPSLSLSAASATSLNLIQLKQPTIVLTNLVSVNGTVQIWSVLSSSILFPKLVAIIGDFDVRFNELLTFLSVPTLATIGGKVIVLGNPSISRIATPSLVRLSGTTYATIPFITSRCETSVSGSLAPTDILSCSVVEGNRDIFNSTASMISNPALTLSLGYLFVQQNSVLTMLVFNELTFVAGYLHVARNPALGFASFAKLTYVRDHLFFCESNIAFMLPVLPRSATKSGQTICAYQSGTGSCSPTTACL